MFSFGGLKASPNLGPSVNRPRDKYLKLQFLSKKKINLFQMYFFQHFFIKIRDPDSTAMLDPDFQ
jgi:hypothetical protein